jgi:hypothetical protein
LTQPIHNTVIVDTSGRESNIRIIIGIVRKSPLAGRTVATVPES